MGVAEFKASIFKDHQAELAKRQAQERRTRAGRAAFAAGQLAVTAAFKAGVAENHLTRDQYPLVRTVVLPGVVVDDGTEVTVNRFDRRELPDAASRRTKFKPMRFSLAIKAGDAQEQYAEVSAVGDIRFTKPGEHPDEDYQEVATIFQAVAADMEARVASE